MIKTQTIPGKPSEEIRAHKVLEKIRRVPWQFSDEGPEVIGEMGAGGNFLVQ